MSFNAGSKAVRQFLCVFHVGTGSSTRATLALLTEKSQDRIQSGSRADLLLASNVCCKSSIQRKFNGF